MTSSLRLSRISLRRWFSTQRQHRNPTKSTSFSSDDHGNYLITQTLRSPETGATVHLFGSIHDIPWFSDEIARRITEIKPNQLVLELGPYAKDLVDFHTSQKDMHAAARRGKQLDAEIIGADFPLLLTIHRIAIALWKDIFRGISSFGSWRGSGGDDARLTYRGAWTLEDTVKYHQDNVNMPNMRRVLFSERDKRFVRALRLAPGPVVVGVVGKLHIPGILDLWDKPMPSGGVFDPYRD